MFADAGRLRTRGGISDPESELEDMGESLLAAWGIFRAPLNVQPALPAAPCV